MDGTIYATLSRNLAEGQGSFWQPSLSQDYFETFFEHPPLGIAMLSLAFSTVGDYFWVEKVYGLCLALLTMGLLNSIWKSLYKSEYDSYGWIPSLLWLVTPLTFWSVTNNMLESTLVLYVLLSFKALLAYLDSNKSWLLIAAGLCLSASMLSKGFVGLFMWSFFFWEQISSNTWKRYWAIPQTLILVGITLAPIVALYFFNPTAHAHMAAYFDNQVVRSIQEVQTADYRTQILFRLFREVIPMLILSGIALLLIRPIASLKLKRNAKSWLCMGLAISAVLPLMITLKQRGFYLIPAFPFLALAMAPLWAKYLTHRDWSSKVSGSRLGITISMVLLAAGLVSTFSFKGSIGRKTDRISDMKTIIDYTGEHARIGIAPELYDDYLLRSTMYRMGHVDLDILTPLSHALILIEGNTKLNSREYEVLELDTPLRHYTLLKIKSVE